MSSVSGNVALRFREYENKMPQLRIVFCVMTLDGSRNHILWNQDYSQPTKAALRNMATAGLRAMAADNLYPTPPMDEIQAAILLQPQQATWAPPTLALTFQASDGG